MVKITKRQITEAGDTAILVTNPTQNTYTTQTTRVSATLTNAPPGDYLVDLKFSVQPSGNGNGTVDITTDSTGTIQGTGAGFHAADTDFNSTKYLHRVSNRMIKSHPGGTFTVNAVLYPEAAVNYIFGNSGDGRWATQLRVTKVG